MIIPLIYLEILRFAQNDREIGRRETVNGRRLENGVFVVILRSPPQADDEESKRGVKPYFFKYRGSLPF